MRVDDASGHAFKHGEKFARQAHGRPLSWQNVVLSGLADLSHVQKIELLSTDCSRREIRVDAGGFFLDVTSPGSIARGVWPYRLLGEDRNGRVVQRIDVEPETPIRRKREQLESMHLSPEPAARSSHIC